MPTSSVAVDGAWCEISGCHCEVRAKTAHKQGRSISNQGTRTPTGSQIKAHLCPNVFVAGWADQREADEEYVSLGVGQRPETVIVLLASSIPKAERDSLVIDHHVGRVVVEDYERMAFGINSARARGTLRTSGDVLSLHKCHKSARR